jgi:GDP-D-mannose 3',5'-epimerase
LNILGYGLEKLYAEKLLLSLPASLITGRIKLINTNVVRIARYHNIFGGGTWIGGREKAPAAIMRKVLCFKKLESLGEMVDSVPIWGNGQAIRSYLHIDDCVEASLLFMRSNFPFPLNIGSSVGITVDELVDICCHVFFYF